MLVLAILSLALAVFDRRHQHQHWLYQLTEGVIAPIQYVVSIPADLWQAFEQKSLSRHQLLIENEKLKTELLLLKAQAQRLPQLELENKHLRALLGAVEERRERRKIADILSIQATEFRHEVVINRGTKDQVYVGQPVLDATGVMGQVIQVSPITARVMLITDDRSSIPVQNARNGIRAIISGTGELTRLVLQQVPHSLDFKEGDTLLTSGLGGLFPAGLPVGKVSVVIHNLSNPYADIEVVPLARLQRSGQVILLWTDGNVPDDSGGTAK